MIIFTDAITGDELCSDAFKLEDVGGVLVEVNSQMITIKEGEVDIGANASAEEQTEELADGAQTVNNLKEAQEAAKKIVANFKDYEFFVGESMNPDGMAYINPELSDKSREEGNTCFKNGDFATAVKHYTESIKRNPSDPRAYTNRAASNSKLPALPEALKDTDSAIGVNPNFTKAYIRKALTLLAMKDCRHNRSYS
ncbi:Mss4-like protein [Phakopsora pachyrhizi]|uniref:Translationally-controlled tumor protein homolog n=1 Tax=Phakopsora pachyrhizi TaxID=170000 RepID=A0AAV0B563_PHAPC|nr:Mss4-like protein [Phakopsora pachyrhizi]